MACICYTIAFLFSPPLHGSELEALRLDDDMDEDDCPPSNLYLQNDLGLAGHTYDYGKHYFCISTAEQNLLSFLFFPYRCSGAELRPY